MLRWTFTAAVVASVGAIAPDHFGGPAQSHSRKAIELRAFPKTTPEPGSVRVTAHVERDHANRALTIAAECSDYLRRSTFQLDGAAAPRKHVIIFEHLPACKYDVTATLHRNTGEAIEAVEVVIVTR